MKIKSLGDLPQDIAPTRDLWPQIAAQIAPSAHPAQLAVTKMTPAAARTARLRWLAAAAPVTRSLAAAALAAAALAATVRAMAARATDRGRLGGCLR